MNRARMNTPISRGFEAAGGVQRLTVAELVALQYLTEWAARGCLHDNHTALGAQLMEDAAWLRAQIGERAAAALRLRESPHHA